MDKIVEIDDDFFDFCRKYENYDIAKLLLSINDKNCKYDVHSVINQVSGLQTTKNKLPLWYENNILYPVKLSLEQSSSEITAEYKRSIAPEGKLLIDLTGGMGIDCLALSNNFDETYYVEHNKELCVIAKYNFKKMSYSNIKVFFDNAVNFMKDFSDIANLIYIDPARRDNKGNKIFSIADCTPNILDIQDLILSKSNYIMIKLSPMLDIKQALRELRYVESVHIVSIKNECKELVFVINTAEKRNSLDAKIHCINFTQQNIEKYEFDCKEEDCTFNFTDKLYDYLYEPNVSILKAGAFKSIASKFNLYKLHNNSHLYTSNEIVKNFPGRIFKISKQSTFNKLELKKSLKGITSANVKSRNFPIKSSDLQKKLKLKDGNDKYIFATTLSNNQKVILICDKIK